MSVEEGEERGLRYDTDERGNKSLERGGGTERGDRREEKCIVCVKVVLYTQEAANSLSLPPNSQRSKEAANHLKQLSAIKTIKHFSKAENKALKTKTPRCSSAVSQFGFKKKNL